MQLAVGAPLLGAVLAGVQYFDTHLWQAVVLSYIGAPFIGAYLIVMAPLLLQLLPRSGGLGERIGVLFAPFNLCSVVLAYIAAIVIDATGNYRLIWLFPAATGLLHALVNCWLKYPERRSTSPDMVKRLWEWAIVQAESMAETGIVTGLLAAPLLGVVTEEDADSAVVIDMARNILGNPYADDDTPAALPPGDGSGDEGSTGDGQPSAGGSFGVTGVDQVGGGPVGDLEYGDQKFGRGEDASSESPSATSSSADGARDAEPLPVPDIGAVPTTGVPDTGVSTPPGGLSDGPDSSAGDGPVVRGAGGVDGVGGAASDGGDGDGGDDATRVTGAKGEAGAGATEPGGGGG